MLVLDLDSMEHRRLQKVEQLNMVATRSGSKSENGVSNGSSNSKSNGISNGVNGTSENGIHSNGHITPYGTKIAKLQESAFSRTLSPLFLLALCPQTVLWLWYTIKYHNGSFADFAQFVISSPNPLKSLFIMWTKVEIGTAFSLSVIGGYWAVQLILMKIVPGPKTYGTVTPHGNLPEYTDNGFRIYLITMATFAAFTAYLKLCTPYSISLVYDNYGDLLATMNIVSLVFCLLLYFKGAVYPSTTDSSLSGNPIFDYYWGTELYPRVFDWDIKVFTNCRFGCTVWGLLTCCYTMKAYELYGFEGSINNFVSLIILQVYLTKFFWWEAGYMCTIDIILDRAGFYICWGCLCWIPGLYTNVGYYLVSHPVEMGYGWASANLAAGLGCVLVNYIADWQKQEVRATDGDCLIWGKKPSIIRAKYFTSQGEEKNSILLVSGFWAISRHFHYLPELGLAMFWTIPAGFNHVLPYCYWIFLFVLLFHRSLRDDYKCETKYGKYWKEYQSRVPYRIIPYVF